MPVELIALHSETLFTLDERGDMLMSNEPFAPCRKRATRLYLGWNESGSVARFRNDIDEETRDRFRHWLADRMLAPYRSPDGLDDLCSLFGVPVAEARFGPAYMMREASTVSSSAVVIDRSNADLLPVGSLVEGEIDHIDPSFMVIRNGGSVSTCLTVRLTDRSIEAGVDTLEAHRGQGYAVESTAAWVNASLDADLIPFYSTSEDNVASQRVAEKVGFTWFATELGIP
tara:strand:+ start:400 stop:1086 length:687 start_codon:yes stop_codon:yes gene_type:complete